MDLDSLHSVLLCRALGLRGVRLARACALAAPPAPLFVTDSARRLVDRQLDIIKRLRLSWVPPWQWPRAFDLVRGSACGLFVRGDANALHLRAVSFVGTRRAHPSAEGWTAARAFEAATAEYAVVSGGAVGIDAAAHQGALEAGGRTLAFVGVGCDALYPASNRSLFGRVLERGGAIVSEHPPGEGGRSFDHAARNRFIAAAGSSLWIAEAALGSGTLGTASWAKRLGRPIWISPEHVGRRRAGLELLLADGARSAANFLVQEHARRSA